MVPNLHTPAGNPSGDEACAGRGSARHVLLIGLRASGKSTVASHLAARLGLPAIDLDDRTRALLGAATVQAAFRDAGEAAFRTAETEALTRALAESAHVIALGGGTPTAAGAAELITAARRDSRAFVVFLDPPLEVLTARLAADAGDRPSLTGLGVVEETERLATARRPLYTALADFIIQEQLECAELVERIVQRVRGTEPS